MEALFAERGIDVAPGEHGGRLVRRVRPSPSQLWTASNNRSRTREPCALRADAAVFRDAGVSVSARLRPGRLSGGGHGPPKDWIWLAASSVGFASAVVFALALTRLVDRASRGQRLA